MPTIYEDQERAKMSFEQWLKAKEKEEKQITHGAEAVPLKTCRGLYDLESVLLNICFDNLLRFMNLYFIPDGLMDHNATGLYGYNRIMIDQDYWKQHGVDDAIIGTMFHELCHAWDDSQNIQDTDGDYHNEHFKKAAEEHGGVAYFNNAEDGYNIVRPTPATMERIKKELRSR